MMSEESKKKLRELGREDLIEIDELNASGYIGCMPNGNLVDRRKFPQAYPVQENSLFGIAKPKKVDNDPHI